VNYVVSNSQNNWVLVDMPLVMARRVLVQDEHGQMVPDRSWHERAKMRYRSLFDFLLRNELINHPAHFSEDIDRVVFRENDLTAIGLEFWKTGAAAKWLGSFDTKPDKDVNDHKQLERVLSKLRVP
jgi:hypothetical protein